MQVKGGDGRVRGMHTPGPWVATLEKWHAYVDAVKYGATLAQVDGDGGMVDVYQPANETLAGEWYEMSTEERDANARLIAAAPELLEALVRCLEQLDFDGRADAPCTELARAAIAKAIGK